MDNNVFPSNSPQSSPSGLCHEGRRQYQHMGGFLVPSQTNEQHDLVYVSLLDGNILAALLPSTRPSLQHTMAEGPLIQPHTTTTPPTIAKKQACNTLGNNDYISNFTKHISCS